jgi:hypothetical protein
MTRRAKGVRRAVLQSIVCMVLQVDQNGGRRRLLDQRHGRADASQRAVLPERQLDHGLCERWRRGLSIRRSMMPAERRDQSALIAAVADSDDNERGSAECAAAASSAAEPLSES